MYKIAPSILAANILNLGKEITDLDKAGADYFHIDIMDGNYVPNLTFGPEIVKKAKKITKKTLDVHLMIKNVEKFIPIFSKSGADIISFHPEAVNNTKKIIKLIKKHKVKAGLAIHPNVKVSDISKYLNLIDIVVVMTVVPGFAGQKFMKNQIKKISFLKKYKENNNLNFDIEIDGGINYKTANICKKEGANILVAGSFIYGSKNKNYKKIIKKLKK